MLPLLFCLLIHTVQSSNFNPTVEVRQCSAAKVTIRVTNAADGGIIYIQGRSSECVYTTVVTSLEFEFRFDVCNLTLDMLFRVIVQESATVQTGSDKVIPVMCIMDMGDIVVGNVYIPVTKGDDNSINATVLPRATMRVVTSTASDVSGSSIFLNEQLTLVIALEEPFKDDFDIKAKDCVAASLPIVQGDCAQDREMFPDFESDKNGTLTATFNAFVPTSVDSNSNEVDISYTCTLNVCRGRCGETLCETIYGSGRRRKRSSNEDITEGEITVGTSVRVLRRQNPNETMKSEHDYCMDKIVLFATSIGAGLLLILSWVICCYLYQRMLTLKGISKMNLAKSIGRRVSSMLNMQSGYDLNGHKVLYAVPEDGQKAGRKIESLPVSISTQTDTFNNSCKCNCHSPDTKNPITPTNISLLTYNSTKITRLDLVENFSLNDNTISDNDESNDEDTDDEDTDDDVEEDPDEFDYESESIVDETSLGRSCSSANPSYLNPDSEYVRPLSSSKRGKWKSLPNVQPILIDNEFESSYRSNSDSPRDLQICLPEEVAVNKETKV